MRDEPIRKALDQVIDAQSVAMRGLTQQLIDGQISLATWESSMMQAVKSVHLVGTATAVGGWNQMDDAWNGWTGQRVRTQYSFLRGFAADLASGRQKLDGTALARSTLYAQAARGTNREAERRAAKLRDLAQEKSNLGAADHCGLCIQEASRGWQPIGTLLSVGDRTCLARCRCWFTYKGVA